MSVTVADLNTEFNTFIGDSSTDRVTAAQRLAFHTQATSWMKEELENDHAVSTYDLNFYDTVHYYKITTAIADYFDVNDLRAKLGDNYTSFTNKSSREMAEDVAQNSSESAYAIERRDGQTFLLINHDSKYRALVASTFDSLTDGGGTWVADTTTSDALNLAVDTNDYTQGVASLKFDADVSQSVNNRITISNSTLNAEDLSDDKDISAWLLDIKFPSVTYISSVTLYWGSSASNYYSVTQTTDQNGNAFVVDWQTLKFDWLGASITGTPDDAAISYIRIDVNYSVSQTDATSFKVDYLRLVQPEKLKFYYTDWRVGTSNAGADIFKFTATTDIPYFSGLYDQYIYPVAHYSAALCFRSLRLYSEADKEELEARKAVERLRKIVPSSVVRESKNFKVFGVRFNRGSRHRGRFLVS